MYIGKALKDFVYAIDGISGSSFKKDDPVEASFPVLLSLAKKGMIEILDNSRITSSVSSLSSSEKNDYEIRISELEKDNEKLKLIISQFENSYQEFDDGKKTSSDNNLKQKSKRGRKPKGSK